LLPRLRDGREPFEAEPVGADFEDPPPRETETFGAPPDLAGALTDTGALTLGGAPAERPKLGVGEVRAGVERLNREPTASDRFGALGACVAMRTDDGSGRCVLAVRAPELPVEAV
jgi:hypothetical protein